MNTPNHLTDAQQQSMRNQQAFALSLLTQGAVYRVVEGGETSPVLTPSDAQVDRLHAEMEASIFAKRREEFLKSTPEGHIITNYSKRLGEIAGKIGVKYLGHTAALTNSDGQRIDYSLQPEDLDLLSTSMTGFDTTRLATDSPVAQRTYGLLGQYRHQLAELTDILTRRDGLRLGVAVGYDERTSADVTDQNPVRLSDIHCIFDAIQPSGRITLRTTEEFPADLHTVVSVSADRIYPLPHA